MITTRLFLFYLFLFVAAAPLYSQTHQIEHQHELILRAAEVKENSEWGNGFSVSWYGQAKWTLNENFSSELEYRWTENIRSDHFFDGVNDNGEPLLMMPSSHRVYRAHLDWSMNDSHWRAGRFTLNVDDGAMVSDFPNELTGQSFDGVHFRQTFFEQSSWQYAYISQINRIFGSEASARLEPNDVRFATRQGSRPWSELGEHNVDAHVLHFRFEEWDKIKMSGYGIRLNNHDAAYLNAQTVGGRLEWNHKPDDVRYFTHVELAQQKPLSTKYAKNTYYSLVESGMGYAAFRWSLADERFHKRGSSSFIPPLSYLDDYYGRNWLYPQRDRGLINQKLQLRYRQNKQRWLVSVHQWFDDEDREFLAKQWSVEWRYRFQRHQALTVFWTRYDPKAIDAIDVKRLWMTYSYRWK